MIVYGMEKSVRRRSSLSCKFPDKQLFGFRFSQVGRLDKEILITFRRYCKVTVCAVRDLRRSKPIGAGLRQWLSHPFALTMD